MPFPDPDDLHPRAPEPRWRGYARRLAEASGRFRRRDPSRRFTDWLIVATIAFFILTLLQWRTLDRLDAILRATTLATQRPWLSAQLAIVGPLRFSQTGDANLTVRIALKNVGNSVAGAIEAEARLIPAETGERATADTIERQKELCARARQDSSGEFARSRLTLFPNETGALSAPLSMPADQVKKGMLATQEVGLQKVSALVIGCVTYRSRLASEAHQTGFAYAIGKFNAENPSNPTALDVGAETPASDIVLSRWFFGGNYAE